MTTSLFNQLRQLGLPSGDYAIFGSGPLLVRGIIPMSNDLDVICRLQAWQLVCTLGEMECSPEFGVNIVTMSGGALTFGTRWGIGDFDVDTLIDTAETIDGLPFVQLEHVVRYKKIRASARDLQHLRTMKTAGYL
jgi:hypothetical protein